MKTADDFIQFFEAIPEERWSADVGVYPKLPTCAYGHLYRACETMTIPERRRICAAFEGHVECIVDVNDKPSDRYPQPTPKQRILAALREAKGRE